MGSFSILCPAYGRTPSLLVAGVPLAHAPFVGVPFMVTRCVCCDITFTDLLRIARLHNTNSVGKLHEVAQFGEGCGLCLPYVSLMLRTGRVSFAPSEPFETVALSDESAVASPNEPLSAPQQHRDG